MNIQVERHQPLITKRIVFTHRLYPPPPKISRRLEFSIGGGGRLRTRLAIGNDTNMISHGQPTTPSPMDVDRVTPIPTQSTSPASIPSPQINQANQSKPHNGRTAARFSTTTRSQTPKPSRSETSHQKEHIKQSNITKKSVTIQHSDSDSESLSSMSSMNDTPSLIPKPRGEVGQPQSGGYNLQEALGWSERTYENVVDLVHNLTKQMLDVSKSFSKQDKKTIIKVCEAARKEYTILCDYENDWPVRDFLKLHLKYTAEAGRRAEATKTMKKFMKALTRTA